MMMGTSRSSSSSSNQNPNVFTAAQWEELEQQALIYKYMVSGVPVPSDLILSVRRSLLYTSSSSSYSSSSSSLSANQPTLWEGYNQLYQQIGGGYGRKIDLEPGRCRRTDGKKWRCSKEAYPDSKYCERHMHRGRNRSRKPVEFPTSSNTASSPISKSISHSDPYPPFSSIHTNFMDSSSYSHQTLKDYRNLQGMKDLGEDAQRSGYFQLSDPYTNTQKMSSGHHLHHHNYSHLNFQNLKDQQKKEDETQGGQHCFVMGTDFIKPSEEATKSRIQVDPKADETTSSKQPFHHFFSPPKTTLNPHPNHDLNWVDPPKAPLSTQDLFQSKPRPCW